MNIVIEKYIKDAMQQTEKSIKLEGNENEVSKIIEILNKLIAETK